MEYLSGNSGGMSTLSNKYDIPNSTLRNWIYKYDDLGSEWLNKKLYNNKYSGEFKLSVIQYRQINECSYREAAEVFNLPNDGMVANWNKIYLEKGLSGLENKQGRPRKDMTNKNNNPNNIPLTETEREELIRLREENRLLKMKEIYEKKLSALLLTKDIEARKKPK